MTLDLLRFTTAGSVDDGKSTLIGRLLYDTKQVFEDQLEHVAQASERRGGEGSLDLALLTDGLRAEREQGITIDVAYRYFATAKRRFIIADCPGPPAVHAQHGHRRLDGRPRGRADRRAPRRARAVQAPRLHQRAAGHPRTSSWRSTRWTSSTTRRSASRRSSGRVRGLRRAAAGRARLDHLHPHLRAARRQRRRALGADALVRGARAARAPRERGSRLRPPRREAGALPGPVGDPPGRRHGERATTAATPGQLASGALRRGEEVAVVLPPSPPQRTRIAAIDTFDGPLEEAIAPMSVTLRLEDELDISRGELICHPEEAPAVARELRPTSAGCAESRCGRAGATCSSTPRAGHRGRRRDSMTSSTCTRSSAPARRRSSR